MPDTSWVNLWKLCHLILTNTLGPKLYYIYFTGENTLQSWEKVFPQVPQQVGGRSRISICVHSPSTTSCGYNSMRQIKAWVKEEVGTLGFAASVKMSMWLRDFRQWDLVVWVVKVCKYFSYWIQDANSTTEACCQPETGINCFAFVYRHAYGNKEASLVDFHRKPSTVESHLFASYIRNSHI